ncbi:MAG: Smr/MutS family protein [Deltaproteobacteria bacterium]|nr:Smr/MutS family protein [Deltaproteobacteria bacterium]
MHEPSLDILEFPAVLAVLANCAQSVVGAEKLLGLRPLKDADAIRDALAEYAELEGAIAGGVWPGLGEVRDIRPLVFKAAPQGAHLDPVELLHIRDNLHSSVRLKALLSDLDARKKYPLIAVRVENLSDLSGLAHELGRILDDKGFIKDNASPTLLRIRREIARGRNGARAVIDEIRADTATAQALQEDYITIREDRYCLALKAGMHNVVDGVIHGASASGATFFKEPLVLVRLNNRVAELRKDEAVEELEILKAATTGVREAGPALLNDLETLISFDCLEAKKRFAGKIGGIAPVVKPWQSDVEFELIGARHPLLVLKAGIIVTPIDIAIHQERVLVISGANTGGKTVALKTIGLLTLMATSGIPVPAGEASVFVNFPSVFADIGDSQDITASLSTFSAHVRRVKEFLEVEEGALVLIDEIGAGTDPAEGGAFALAVLEHLKQRGALCVVTTHLNILKGRAATRNGYLNASVEFDEASFKPLYRLRSGAPGPSLGLSIAQSLGVPDHIIEAARGFISPDEGAFMESIRRLDEEREAVAAARKRLDALASRRDKALERFKGEREGIRARSRASLESIVSAARAQIEFAINALKKAETTGDARRIGKDVNVVYARTSAVLSPSRAIGQAGCAPQQGDKVKLSESGKKGVVMRVDAKAGKAEVMVGGLKIWAAFDRLTQTGPEVDKRQAMAHLLIEAQARTINIIGSRVAEGIAVVQRFLDNAHMAGLESVEIIHGTGTGVLARSVAEYLRACPFVKGFRLAVPEAGGPGVTVVELK